MASPPLIFNHAEDGFVRVGIETSDRVTRKSQVQVASGNGASLRIFKDGGWELRATPNEKGSNILQRGEGPLNIYSDGDVNINCKGEFSVKAKSIRMETTDSEGNFIVNAKKNIRLDADNNVTVLGTNIVTKGSGKILTTCDGMHILAGNPIIIYEKKAKLIPTGVADLVDTLLGNVLLS